MAFKQLREPKIPTLKEAGKYTAAGWLEQEQIARQRLVAADNSRARQHQMDRISYCQIALEMVKRGDYE